MDILLILPIVIAASFVGTMTGFGTSTIMVPVFLFFYPAPETLLFVGIIHWFGNIWKLLLFKKGFQWKLILSFGIPGIAATFLGASLMFNISTILLSRILGSFLIIYVIYLFAKSSFKIKPSLHAGAFGGAVSGFLAGIFGMGGAVRGLFLTAFDLPKAVYITTAGAIALIIDSTRLTTYFAKGARLEHLLLWGLLLFIPASFLGAKLAQYTVNKIPQEHFRKVVSVFLFLIGIKLLLWPK
ncbi:MAG: sulfite exporter TauE/SafE family protein [Sedimentisphaerales bacterium]|nr:sulfite exporter TauE/SafE family protein [Sedimentisphaerales bacterium]